MKLDIICAALGAAYIGATLIYQFLTMQQKTLLKIIYSFVNMGFKQKLAIGLCTFYMLSVIGVALSMHFCGGKLASVSLYSNQTACKLCKAEPVEKKDDGCCKNTKVDVKVKDSHQTESSFKLPKLFSIDTFLHPRTSEIIKRLLPSVFSRISNKAPPKSSRVALHVFNCVFRN